MEIKITSSGKSEKNRPLARFAYFFTLYTGFNEELDRLLESPPVLSEEPLDRRRRLLLLYSKVAFAIKGLNMVLGRPPTVAEVAEATNEDEQRVRRFLKGDYAEIRPEMLPFRISLEEGKSAFTRWWRKGGRGEGDVIKVIFPKRVGRPPMDFTSTFMKDGGRPSTMVMLLEGPDRLEEVWQGLSEPERSSLEAYFRSKPFVDLFREILIKRVRLSFKILDCQELAEGSVDTFKKMVQRILQIARRCDSPRLTPELERYLTFDWVLQGLKASKQNPKSLAGVSLDEIIKMFKTMPDDEFASKSIIASFKAEA